MTSRRDEDVHHLSPANNKPPILNGKLSDCPQQWRKYFDRVAKYNGLDNSLGFANVIHFLDGIAKYWFQNFEECISRDQTENCAQRIDESSCSYIQDIINLCSSCKSFAVCYRIEALNKKIIRRPLFERISNVAPIPADCDIDIKAFIRRAVKE
ncbi:hypothetical protein LAZ67_2003381 [Cordylochernes scorpioides]|uniref:Uncharacterized protein n=1 Tax=Cordylochernes scorpioides TaxID=51811 RepID=A0ABY6K2W4_9ARAC|nr:hypothetical protein LAZ67_2003381 [Cordylochernes scorpioides]